MNLYLLHSLIIVLAFAFPSIGQTLHSLFQKTTPFSIDRSSGLFMGYDFAAYFIGLFLVNFISYSDASKKSFLLIGIGLVALLLTGRTGLFLAASLSGYLVFKFRWYKSPIVLVILLGLGAFFFNKVLYSLFSVGLIEKGEFYTEREGSYDLSFFVVLREWSILIDNFWKNFFGTREFQNLDPGPAYIIHNLGFITYLSYIYAYIHGHRMKLNLQATLNIFLLIVGEFKINVLLSRGVAEYSLLSYFSYDNKLENEISPTS